MRVRRTVDEWFNEVERLKGLIQIDNSVENRKALFNARRNWYRLKTPVKPKAPSAGTVNRDLNKHKRPRIYFYD